MRTLILPIVLLASFVVSANFAEAVMLRPIANISIFNASLTNIGGDKYSVDFRVRNDNPSQDLGKLKYGVRVQEQSGVLLSENVYGDVMFEGPSNSAQVSAFIEPPLGLSGTYEVFVIVKNESGILLSASHAGDIESDAKGILPTLEGCTVVDVAASIFNCEVEDTEGSEMLSYKVYKGSIYEGSEVLSGAIDADALNENFGIEKLSPGKYEVSFELKDQNSDKIYPSQRVLNFKVPGNWASISFFSSSFTNNELDATVRFDGSGSSEQDRGFNYWVLSDTDNVCASGTQDLTNLIPYQRNISEQFTSDCIAPRFVAYLYDGKNTDGSLNIVDTIGEADFANLPIPVNKQNSPNSTNTILIIVVLLVLVIVAWYFFIHKKEGDKMSKKAGITVGALFLFIFFVPSAFVSAAAWSSQDNPNIQFSVNFTKSAYAPDENIVLTFGFDDKRGAAQTAHQGVYVKVGNGSYVEILTPVQSEETYNIVSISGIATGGSHTLTFKASGMCGSAFNYSLFGIGLFGTDDCEFQTTVNVGTGGIGDPNYESNPTINVSGACTPGETDTFTFFSTYDGDENGVQDNIYYDIVWDDGSTGRIPLNSGYVQAGIAQTSQVTWPSGKTGNYSVSVRATAQDGRQSVWGETSGGCGVTTQSCGDGALQIWLGETCDDGNSVDNDQCNNSCSRNDSTYCGDGVVQAWAGEECDGTSDCTATCLNESSCTVGFGISSDKTLVRTGDSADITWISAGDMTSCRVKSQGATLWSGNAGTQPKVISGAIEFELSCDSACSGNRLSTTTKVDIVPAYREN